MNNKSLKKLLLQVQVDNDVQSDFKIVDLDLLSQSTMGASNPGCNNSSCPGDIQNFSCQNDVCSGTGNLLCTNNQCTNQ